MTALTLFSPSGVVAQPGALRLAAKRLAALGFQVAVDEAALARHQRFAGDDATRLAALHPVAGDAPAVAMGTRGGYGLTRLLDGIDWALLGHSVERSTPLGRPQRHDGTAARLARARRGAQLGRAAGLYDFGAAAGDDRVTGGGRRRDARLLRRGNVRRTSRRWAFAPGRFDGLLATGRLWGGNLAHGRVAAGHPTLAEGPRRRALRGRQRASVPRQRMLLQLLSRRARGRRRRCCSAPSPSGARRRWTVASR